MGPRGSGVPTSHPLVDETWSGSRGSRGRGRRTEVAGALGRRNGKITKSN